MTHLVGFTPALFFARQCSAHDFNKYVGSELLIDPITANSILVDSVATEQPTNGHVQETAGEETNGQPVESTSPECSVHISH